MAKTFQVGDIVRPISARGMEHSRYGDGRCTIAVIQGNLDSPYGYWFHTSLTSQGPWRDLTEYELAPELEK